MDLETRQSYCEVNRILEIISEDLSNKIPVKLKEFFKREMDKTYIPQIDINKPIRQQKLKRKTLIIISNLNLQYWCKDENKKLELLKKYSENNKKHQEELREKYNPQNVFKQKIKTSEENLLEKPVERTEEVGMVEYKEPLFRRILNKVKAIFIKKAK